MNRASRAPRHSGHPGGTPPAQSRRTGSGAKARAGLLGNQGTAATCRSLCWAPGPRHSAHPHFPPRRGRQPQAPRPLHRPESAGTKDGQRGRSRRQNAAEPTKDQPGPTTKLSSWPRRRGSEGLPQGGSRDRPRAGRAVHACSLQRGPGSTAPWGLRETPHHEGSLTASPPRSFPDGSVSSPRTGLGARPQTGTRWSPSTLLRKKSLAGSLTSNRKTRAPQKVLAAKGSSHGTPQFFTEEQVKYWFYVSAEKQNLKTSHNV